MRYFATVTSQYQITVPKEIRKKLKLKSKDKIFFDIDHKNEIKVSKGHSFMDLAGKYHSYALKNKTLDETLKIEQEALEEAIVEDVVKSNK